MTVGILANIPNLATRLRAVLSLGTGAYVRFTGGVIMGARFIYIETVVLRNRFERRAIGVSTFVEVSDVYIYHGGNPCISSVRVRLEARMRRVAEANVVINGTVWERLAPHNIPTQRGRHIHHSRQ